MPTSQGGIVYLAGAGPGDPGLLTVRAQELLSHCDVVVYDALVSKEVLGLCPPQVEKLYVGKRGARHDADQPEINAVLFEKARAGKKVVRLK
jgi:siroheme synthase